MQAFAKINWALAVTGRREDGYHLLDMLMQEISLHDDLEFKKAETAVLTVNGEAESEPEKNLIIKAVRLLERITGRELPVEVSLTKRIPSRAGLGGGSSDCACTLMAVNELYGLGFAQDELAEIGLKLGADVPFFIYGGFSRVKGIGEMICPILRTPKYWLVIKQAGMGLSTPEVFRKSDEVNAFSECLPDSLADSIADGFFGGAENDLEKPAFMLEPETGELLNAMKNLPNALYARMSGSGSAVYAVFACEEEANKAADILGGATVARTLTDRR